MLEKTINNAICALLFRCEQQSVKEMDKIHAMQLFIKVAELESFSRAADFFALPKGSVSRQIQALEHQLGTQLLQRTTRRVKLTPEGMTYYQRAKDVLSNLSELDGLFQQDATSISGKLRIDIPPGIAKSLLLPRLSEFLYLHPGIELELSSHDRPVDILHDGFDCVIRTGALPEDGVIARPLGKLTMVNCASPHYLTRFGYPQSPDDLTSHAIVRYTPHLGVHPLGFEVIKIVMTYTLPSLMKSPSGAAFGSVLGLMAFFYFFARLTLFCAAWIATAEYKDDPRMPGKTQP